MKTWQRATLSIFVGLLVFLLLFPFYGIDVEPVEHYSVFGNRVPSGSPLLAFAAAILAGGVAWVLTRPSHSAQRL